MSWLFYVLVGVPAALIAWAVNSLLAARKAGWSRSWRVLASALLSPALILLASAAAVVLVRDSTWRDLAQNVVALIGLVAAGWSFAVGLVSAWAAERLGNA
jgi:NADH:ubiquinone oxidoreductase subunit K